MPAQPAGPTPSGEKLPDEGHGGGETCERPYELGRPEEGYPVRIRARGNQVLTTPMLNRGTAFTPEEREALGLTGLLPGGVSTIPLPRAIEHADPGGVSWTKRISSLTLWSWSALKPACSV